MHVCISQWLMACRITLFSRSAENTDNLALRIFTLVLQVYWGEMMYGTTLRGQRRKACAVAALFSSAVEFEVTTVMSLS